MKSEKQIDRKDGGFEDLSPYFSNETWKTIIHFASLFAKFGADDWNPENSSVTSILLTEE